MKVDDPVISSRARWTIGPLDGGMHPEMMAGFGQSSDEWIAAIASYVSHSGARLRRELRVTGGNSAWRAGWLISS